MTPPDRDPDGRLRSFSIADAPWASGVLLISGLALVIGIAMLVLDAPPLVRVIGAAIVVGVVAYLLVIVPRRRRSLAIVVDGDWVGFRHGLRGEIRDWTDLRAVTAVAMGRLHPRRRRNFVSVAIWNERDGRYRVDETWSLAGRALTQERLRRAKEGQHAVCIPLGSMTRADQDAMRAHLAGFGIVVPDPADDAKWVS